MVTDEELLQLAHEVFPELKRHGVRTLYHLVRMAKHAEHHPRFKPAIHVALRDLAGEEHPDVTALRKAAHASAAISQRLVLLCERMIGVFDRGGLQLIAGNFTNELDAALEGVPQEPEPAAETVATPKGFVP